MATNKQKFLRLHNLPPNTSLSFFDMEKLSGFPVEALKEVYSKGEGAYYSNPLSVRMKGSFVKNVKAPMSRKLSPEQWAGARVYAFLMKTKKVFYGADKHIAEKYGLLND
jgi:hypothetical protein